VQVALLADRDVGVTASRVAIEHVAVRRGALQQPRDAVLGAGLEFEVVQDAGSRAGLAARSSASCSSCGVARCQMAWRTAGRELRIQQGFEELAEQHDRGVRAVGDVELELDERVTGLRVLDADTVVKESTISSVILAATSAQNGSIAG